jgi:hypothetical protein
MAGQDSSPTTRTANPKTQGPSTTDTSDDTAAQERALRETIDVPPRWDTATHGWVEVLPYALRAGIAQAARRAAGNASRDLGFDRIEPRFFKPERGKSWDLTNSDRAVVILTVPPFDPGMLGKACHPEAVSPLTVWVRSTLSAGAASAIVYHESRHLWQGLASETTAWSHEQSEDDANRYMATAILQHERFTRRTLRAVLRELGFSV